MNSTAPDPQEEFEPAQAFQAEEAEHATPATHVPATPAAPEPATGYQREDDELVWPID